MGTRRSGGRCQGRHTEIKKLTCYATSASDGFKAWTDSDLVHWTELDPNSPDGSKLFIVYHIHTDPQNPSGDRQVCIDRMGFREDGSLYVAGPTHTLQPIPSSKE